MPKPALSSVVALLIGLGFGYIAWGEHARRTEADFVDQLGAVLGEAREHNRLMQGILVEGEGKTQASLAVCEKAQVQLQKKLEQCLFAKADEAPAIDDDSAAERPRSGSSPVTETLTYPGPGSAPANK